MEVSLTPGKRIGLLLLLAAAVLAVCSWSSPLYAFNPWDDANAYMTIGKSVLVGKVPYRDLYDHKGPFLFLIHTIAAEISFDTFTGVYLLESLAGFFFLFYAYKALNLLLEEETIALLPAVAATVYFSRALKFGDSAEEFSLPFLMFAAYLLLLMTKEDRLPTRKEAFLIGLTSACVFWMKYTVVGFYLGWILLPLHQAIRKKKAAEFFQGCGLIALGVLCCSAAILAYYAAKNSIKDLFEVYFYDNIVKYASEKRSLSGLFLNLVQGGEVLARYYPAGLLLGILAIWKLPAKTGLREGLLATAAGLFFTIFFGGQAFDYCALPFAVYAVFGIGVLYRMIRRQWPSHGKKRQRVFGIAGLAVLMLLTVPKIGNMTRKADEYIQYQVKAKIEERSDGQEVRILNYGMLDQGFYTVMGIVPECRIYYRPNMNSPEFIEQQDAYVSEKKPDYIICKNDTWFYGYHLIHAYPIDEVTGYDTYLYARNGGRP